MGRVRIPGLNFYLPHLQKEVDTFLNLIHDLEWMTKENHTKRRSICEGLTFLLLNLAESVDQKTAWDLFHGAMDEYHDRCDVLGLRY